MGIVFHLQSITVLRLHVMEFIFFSFCLLDSSFILGLRCLSTKYMGFVPRHYVAVKKKAHHITTALSDSHKFN